MKRSIMALMVIQLCLATNAQQVTDTTERKKISHFLNIGYGQPSYVRTRLEVELFARSLINGINSLFQDSTTSFTVAGNTGTILISDAIRIDQKIELEFGVGYQNIPVDFNAIAKDSRSNQSTKIGEYKYRHWTFFVEFSSPYGARKTLSSKGYFYGSLGVGYTFRTEERLGEAVPTIELIKSRLIMPHITPIGYAVNGRRIRFKIDLGFGYRPFITGRLGFLLTKEE